MLLVELHQIEYEDDLINISRSPVRPFNLNNNPLMPSSVRRVPPMQSASMTPLIRDEEEEDEEELEGKRLPERYRHKRTLPGKGMWMKKRTCGQRKVAGKM